jgi:CRISPR/Cas system-associated exonuclease Cas4 (RecB family)
VLFGEIPEDLGLLCGFDVLVGCKVVRNQRNAVPVKDVLDSDFFELPDRHRRCYIIAQHQVHPGVD